MYAMKPFSPRKAAVDMLKKQAGHSEKLEIVSCLPNSFTASIFHVLNPLPITANRAKLAFTNIFYPNV